MEKGELMLNAKIEAGRQALGLVGRADIFDFATALSDFQTAYKFLKEEFEAAIKDVADPAREPNV